MSVMQYNNNYRNSLAIKNEKTRAHTISCSQEECVCKEINQLVYDQTKLALCVLHSGNKKGGKKCQGHKKNAVGKSDQGETKSHALWRQNWLTNWRKRTDTPQKIQAYSHVEKKMKDNTTCDYF